MNKVPLTAMGYQKLQDELKKLINKDRPDIIASIAEARGHGDLSENAEYQYAKEQQSLIEGKIIELESAIAQAEIIDISKLSGSEIKFGATVKIKDDETNEQSTYQIVGEYESDIENKKPFGLTFSKRVLTTPFYYRGIIKSFFYQNHFSLRKEENL